MKSSVQSKIKKPRFFIYFLYLFTCCTFILHNCAQARNLFYVLDRKGSNPDYKYYLKCYDSEGLYQYEFFLYDPPPGDDYSAVATDGLTAWIASNEASAIKGFVIRTGGSGGAVALQYSAGGASGLALAGSSLYASRSLTWGAPTGVIQLYSTAGAYINTWNTLAADNLFPGSLQYVGGNTLIAQRLGNANVYFLDTSNNGNVYASFTTNETYPNGLCANASTVWIKYSSSLLAYDYAGTRQPSLDVTLSGTLPSRYLDIYYAWGPDEGVVSVSPGSIDFSIIPEGSTTQQAVQIKNVGNANLTITGLSLSDTTNYSASSITLPYTLTPGESINPTITFQPQSVDSFDAEYTIQTNDGYPTETTVSLHGTGVNALWYVDFDADSGGDGTSWATAFSSLNEAMADPDILAGSEIRVLSDWTSQGQTISKSVSVYGAYNNSDQRDLRNKTEIRTGGGRNLVISAPNVRLDGFAIVEGNADYGAGLKIDNSNITIANCDIANNIATSYGGGVYITENATASITLSNCRIEDNQSVQAGGIYDRGSSMLTIHNCQIINNISSNGSGGGLYDGSGSGNITMTQCIISNNKSRSLGAGIYSVGPITLTNCLITDNWSNYGNPDPSDSRGAGMYLQDGGELTNCTVANNKILQDYPYGGAGIYSSPSDPLIVTNCIVWGNSDTNGYLQGQQILPYDTATVTYTDIQDDYFLGNNNINQDPCFADPNGFDDDPGTGYDNDYHLLDTSPCKDTATADGAPSEDLDGVTRPLDDGYDRGAYEYIYRYPGPWHVDGDVALSGDGTNWLSPFQAIEDAFDAANPGHEIWVKEGTYALYTDMDRPYYLYAGFDGTEILRSERDWENNPTIIDGDNEAAGPYVTADIILDGFIFQNCSEWDGPALFIEDCDPTIANCTFQYNHAENFGGAVYNLHTLAEYTNCTFFQNSADDSGGAICNEEAAPIFRDCTITYNQAPGLGGGVYNMYADTVFENCVLSGNKATGEGTDGGGMTNDWSDPALTNCLITGNLSSGFAGGISNYKSSPIITNCTITSNRAIESGGDGGGGMGTCDGNPIVLNSIFWNNFADTDKEIGHGCGSTTTVQYSNVDQDGFTGSDGNLRMDPLFAAPGTWDDNGTPADLNDDLWIPGDYHLMSTAGRWEPDTQNWVQDGSASRCIDAGNPGNSLGDELDGPDNLRINMGAYGGTDEASLTPHGWTLLSDANNDGISNLIDLEALGSQWLSAGENLPFDFNRDGIINSDDMALLAQEYLEQTSWH